jgi:hypothetical protein
MESFLQNGKEALSACDKAIEMEPDNEKGHILREQALQQLQIQKVESAKKFAKIINKL